MMEHSVTLLAPAFREGETNRVGNRHNHVDAEAKKQRRKAQNRKNQRAHRLRVKEQGPGTIQTTGQFQVKRWRVDEFDDCPSQDGSSESSSGTARHIPPRSHQTHADTSTFTPKRTGVFQWSPPTAPFRVQMSLSLLSPQLSDEARICFDYFRFKTITKIPGVFYSYFWQKLVLEACVSEPAVLHAVIALGSAHRIDDETLKCASRKKVSRPGVFTLQEYSKAVTYLRNRKMDEYSASLRVVLITCVLFITIDLLRGEYENAQIHTESGWKLMSELQLGDKKKERSRPEASRALSSLLIDEALSESLSCLNIQSSLFGCKSATPNLENNQPIYLSQAKEPSCFRDMSEARKSFNILLNDILSFVEGCRSFDFCSMPYPPNVCNRQVCLKSAIASWKVAFNRSRANLIPPASSKNTILGVYLLRTFLTMASIMVETALSGGRQALFDDYTSHFTSIITQTLRLLKGYSHVRSEMGEPFGSASDLAGDFIADVGMLPFMYYTALKCRVPWIRRQAIAILLTTPIREGMWDSFIMANVARKVMMMEEEGFFDSFADEIEPTPFHSPVDRNERLKHIPSLPESARFHDVELELQGSLKGSGKVILRRQKQYGDGGWEVIASVFDFSELRKGVPSDVDYSPLFTDTRGVDPG